MTVMTVLRRVAALFLLLTAVSCSQKGLDARFDYTSRVGAGADLSKLQTWNWVPHQAIPTGDPRIDDPTFVQSLEGFIAGELQKRGIVKKTENPDFVVNYQVGVQQEFDDEEWMRTYAEEEFSTHNTDWQEGNLLIVFVNPQTGQIIWGGQGQGELDPDASKSEASKNLQKVVEKIFEHLDTDRGTKTAE